MKKCKFKVGDKVRVKCEDARELGSGNIGNNVNLKKGYCGIITEVKGIAFDHNCHWVYVDNKGGIVEKLLELVEDKSEKKHLVFGKFNIGDIVVSLNGNNYRTNGELLEVLPKSDTGILYYRNNKCSSDKSTWRLATPEEIELYKAGGKNINNISKEFVLPEKWMINITPENTKILHKWSKTSYKATTNFVGIGREFYVHSADTGTYPEITFDQFKKYVLKETVKEPKFKVGDWVYLLNSKGKSASQGALATIYKIDSEYIHITWKHKANGQNNGEYYPSDFRKATQSEIDSVTKEEVPEYYEYIAKNTDNNAFINGKIYKIIDRFNLEKVSNFIDNKNTPNGFSGENYKYFKPSTKEAYDRQHQFKSQHQQGISIDIVKESTFKGYVGEVAIHGGFKEEWINTTKDTGFQEPIIRKKVNKVNKLKIVNI